MSTVNTAPADPASAAAYLVDDIDNVRDMTQTIVHQLHFLMQDLERSFDFERGQPFGKSGITLNFQKDAIDAKLWLMSSIWANAKDLDERIYLHSQRIIDDAVAAERRVAA